MELEVSNQSEQQAGKRAAEFFTRPSLSRLVVKLYAKYIEVGQVGGQVILMDATVDERRDIASFLGKRLYADTRLKVSIDDVQKALEHSFQCTLPDILRVPLPYK